MREVPPEEVTRRATPEEMPANAGTIAKNETKMFGRLLSTIAMPNQGAAI